MNCFSHLKTLSCCMRQKWWVGMVVHSIALWAISNILSNRITKSTTIKFTTYKIMIFKSNANLREVIAPVSLMWVDRPGAIHSLQLRLERA